MLLLAPIRCGGRRLVYLRVYLTRRGRNPVSSFFLDFDPFPEGDSVSTVRRNVDGIDFGETFNCIGVGLTISRERAWNFRASGPFSFRLL